MTDRMGRDKLFYIIIDSKISDALKAIDTATDMNFQDKNGYSYLHCAVQSELLSVAKKLIEKGAYIDIKDKFGRTPLMIALSSYNRKNGNREMIDFLIHSGASIYATANSGVSCLQLAKNKGVDLKE